jgi:multicomponent Na+:H+ antiporter subunit F
MIIFVAYAGLVLGAAAAIIALDLLLVTLMTGIVVDAVDRDDQSLLNLLVVIAIIGFTATVAVARFMERSK